MTTAPEISFVMPCLNEAETLATCIGKAKSAIARNGWDGEVVIADNGSTDGSIEIAEKLGARVVRVTEKGYGKALKGGIAAAAGKFIVMADADDSYDFGGAGPFIAKLEEGYDLVMGNRFRGGIAPGAMPWKHRYIGNPILSAIGRLFFGSPARDFHCGLRAFRKEAYERMDLRTTGMEFASEMVIKASILRMRVTEVPTTLAKDGRSRPPHLRSWHDGWRHLRFMLLFSPRWLFLYPGLLSMLVGAAGVIALLGGPLHIGGIGIDIHTMLVAAMLAVVGHQLFVFALFTKAFAVQRGLHPESNRSGRFFKRRRLEWGITAGALVLFSGLALLVFAFIYWGNRRFGDLDPRVTMRRVIPAVLLMMLGVQTMFGSFFLSILDLDKRRP